MGRHPIVRRALMHCGRNSWSYPMVAQMLAAVFTGRLHQDQQRLDGVYDLP